jgi:hypothetical protein
MTGYDCSIVRPAKVKECVTMAIPHDERDLEAELHRIYLEGGQTMSPLLGSAFLSVIHSRL